MAKKLISVWLSLTILLFSSISIYADEEVIQGDFFLKNIVINGENIVNYQLSNPVVMYQDRIYFPLDKDMENILGIDASWDNESRTLKLLKTVPTQKNVAERWVKNNLDDVWMSRLGEANVIACEKAQNVDANLKEQASATDSEQSSDVSDSALTVQESGGIEVPAQQAVQIELKGQPVLVKNEIVYVPINAIVSSEMLGCSLYYDYYSGIYVSTDDEIDAASYFNAAKSREYKALAAYIVTMNPKLTMSQALEMVEYFEAYGQIYGVDLKLLMAIAKTESTYRCNAYSSSKCCGLMQVKVSTGKSYGFSKSDLFQVKPNIQMGTMYIGEILSNFGGNKVKGLAAYNCGAGAVKRGNYSTGYAKKVLNTATSIGSFVTSYQG